jgi:glycyl-tRNA synthetase beta chain
MNFLLEIGTEEIPHWMIPGALAQLAKVDVMGNNLLVDATPRRLVLTAIEVPLRTPDEEQIIKGPPISAGEKAAFGFAKKQGVDPSAMQKTGDYYELRKLVPGRRTIDILAESLPAAILSIQWPKTMCWTGKSGPRFIRPIRWIVALLGDEVIPFEIAGVKSSNITRGHRQLGSSKIPVTFETYESELLRNHVILSSPKRRHKIEKEAANLGAKIDADLLETLTFITEYPTAIKGAFDPAFLELPSEVLTTVMRHHQKYFSVEGPQNLLEPNFVAIMNTSGDPEGLVKHGNERVLKARFNDARFFWNVDQPRKLVDRVPDLERVTFHARLGNYLEKTNRVEELAVKLGEQVDAYMDAVQLGARLCKCDLTTEMVKEFPELQGIVGGLYARAQGLSPEVAVAIYDHYKPIGAGDEIPRNDYAQIVALADKVDTLRESFRIGMAPTGSKDPFALRRAAQGVIRILIEGGLGFRLSELCAGNRELIEFLTDRVRHYLKEVRSFPYDEVNAVISAKCEDLSDLAARLDAVHEVRPTEHFEPLATSFKRIRNILQQAKFDTSISFQKSLLEPGPEQDLWTEYQRILTDLVGAYLVTKDYKTALLTIASIRPTIDIFFDKVLVNVSDPALRANRLSLLSNLLSEFSTIADFSEIVTSGDQK